MKNLIFRNLIKFKNIICFILVLTLLILQFPQISKAEEKKNSPLCNEAIYVSTEIVSKEDIEYAISVKNDILYCLHSLEDDNINALYENKLISYGNPFKLNEISYFPIIDGREILALVGIIDDNNQRSWTLSTDFSEELNNLKGSTSLDEPTTLKIEGAEVFADIKGKSIQLTHNNIDKNIANITNIKSEKTNRISVNILSSDKIDSPKEQKGYNSLRKAAPNNQDLLLNLDLAEKQGSQPWCSAYALAQILRYLGKSKIYAKSIMVYYYPNCSSGELEKKTLSQSQILSYAKKQGFNPTTKSSSLSTAVVRDELQKNNPIYMGCYGSGSYSGSRHALVLRGYYPLANAYSVWNPWKQSYVAVSTNSNKLVVSGGSFTWDKSIYKW